MGGHSAGAKPAKPPCAPSSNAHAPVGGILPGLALSGVGKQGVPLRGRRRGAGRARPGTTVVALTLPRRRRRGRPRGDCAHTAYEVIKSTPDPGPRWSTADRFGRIARAGGLIQKANKIARALGIARYPSSAARSPALAPGARCSWQRRAHGSGGGPKSSTSCGGGSTAAPRWFVELVALANSRAATTSRCSR